MAFQTLLLALVERCKLTLENEAAARPNFFDAGNNSKRRSIIAVALIVFLALVIIWELIIPPSTITKIINSDPGSYYQIRSGKIHFSKTQAPLEIRIGVEKHLINLPDRNISRLAGYDPGNIWYEFEIDLPADSFHLDKTGLLIPLIWGRSRVFVNGELKDFGTNLWPVIALNQKQSHLQIHVDVNGFGKQVPIRATYPLVAGDIDGLRKLTKVVDEQIQTRSRAFTAYCLAIIIFGMLFLAYPKKPELLSFILFLAMSLSGSLLTEQLGDKNILFAREPIFQKCCLVAFDFFTQLSLLIFALLFLRTNRRVVIKKVGEAAATCLLVGLPFSILLRKMIPSFDFEQAGHLTISLFFLIFHVCFLAPRLVFLFIKSDVPPQRRASSTVVFFTVLSLYCFNILDHFFFLETITTLYSNSLILNLALSVTLAYELSRAEVNQIILGSMLPREVKEGINNGRRQVDQRGFIVLVDAVGYAANRNRFDDVTERSEYVGQLAKRILKPVHDLYIRDFSILNCTGDGLYFAIRGMPNLQDFTRLVELAKNITSGVTYLPSEDPILFRAAIGYGNYGVSIVEVGNLRKEFVAGNVLNDLARIISSEKGTGSVRVLMGPEIGKLVPNEESLSSVTDKHGFRHFYLEIGQPRLAA